MAVDARAVAAELRAAARALAERGLRCSAKWAAEQLVGLARAPQLDHDQDMLGAAIGDEPAQQESEAEEDIFLLAKAYFDVNEFLRAAHALARARSDRCRFLRWYSMFLAGEKRKDEESLEESGGHETKPRAVNDQLDILHAELRAESTAGKLDGYGLYVFALTLRELQRIEEAIKVLKQAVSLAPCLWAAWCEIVTLGGEAEADRQVDFSDHWMAVLATKEPHLQPRCCSILS